MQGRGPVLVVDDNPSFLDAMRLFLEGAGYAVACAANGRQALDYLGEHEPPGLILLDLNMPVLDGPGFRREQLRDPALAAVPVLLVSSDADVDRQAGALGAAGYFRKPVEVERLLAFVRDEVKPAGRP
jgi:CheY-like chemotaxis protein